MAFLPNLDEFRHKDSEGNVINGKSLINNFFSPETIKMLYYHACRVDIEDNNDKAEMIKELLGPDFIELGTGTNRIALLHNSFVCKIALDYRGQVDNWTEFKRSMELPEYLVKAYECNMLILICEYVNVMDQEQFMLNEEGIKEILEDLSKAYIFDDIGFTLKNSYNWGYRDSGDIVVLDYGYLYPKKNQEAALSCPKCKALLKYNENYTGFVCSNSSCRTKYRIMDIRRRMNLDLEKMEDKVIAMLNNLEMPDFEEAKVID